MSKTPMGGFGRFLAGLCTAVDTIYELLHPLDIALNPFHALLADEYVHRILRGTSFTLFLFPGIGHALKNKVVYARILFFKHLMEQLERALKHYDLAFKCPQSLFYCKFHSIHRSRYGHHDKA